MVGGCTDSSSPSRQATSGSLGASAASPGSGTSSGRQLVGEYIGSFDPVTKALTIVPSHERNDALGLTGEANVWALGTSGALTVSTTGAYYIDHSGTTKAQGTYTSTMAASGGSAPCLYSGNTCGSSACLAATCALVELSTATSGVSFAEVDLEVSALTTGVTVNNDDKSGRTAAEISASIDAAGLGVWRWPSTVNNTPSFHTAAITPNGVAWQFDTATVGVAWTFGLRAWKLVPVNFSFGTNPVTISAAAGASNTGSSTLTNSGSATTGSLTETYSGSSEITLATDTCAGHTVAAGGTCTVTPKLTCPSGTNGAVTGTFTYTDTTNSVSTTLTVNGTCTGGNLTATPTTVSISGIIGAGAVNGSNVTLKNVSTTTSTGTITLGTLTGTGVSSVSLSTDNCNTHSLAANATCTITPTLTCVSTSPSVVTVTVPYTDTRGDTTSFQINGTCGGLSINPSPIAINSTVNVPTTSSTLATISNASSTATGVLGITTSGSSDFSFSGCAGTTLAGSSTCKVTPTLTCTTADYGTVTGGGSATYTDPSDGASVTLAVTGNCNPLNTNVSSEYVGAAKRNAHVDGATITVTNVATTSGKTTHALTSAITSGTGGGTFSLSTDNCTGSTLAPAGTCTIVPRLTCPSSTSAYGPQTGTVTFTDPTPGSGDSITVNLTGDCGSISFASSTATVAAAVGSTGTASAVHLDNLSGTRITAPNLAGPVIAPTGSPISVTDTCGSSLAANGNCSVTPAINCVGQTAGSTFTATATYTNDVNGSTATLTITGFCGTYHQLIVAAGPVAYWPLDDSPATTTTAVDVIAGNNGTAMIVSGSSLPSFDVSPLITAGTAASFDGHNKVSVPYIAAVNPPVDLSVECWINSAGDTGDYQSCITSRDDIQHPGDVQHGWILYYHNNQAQFWTGNGSNGWNTVVDPTTHAYGTTLYLAGTYTAGTMTLYVNGVSVGTSTAHYSPQSLNPLYIGMGSTETNGEYGFNGTVDEVTVYARALSASEVAEHYYVGTH